jgi:hypothetical protein
MRNESEPRRWSEPEADARRAGVADGVASEPPDNAGTGDALPEFGRAHDSFAGIDDADRDPRESIEVADPHDDARTREAANRGQNDDVPGYAWQDAGAGVTTGSDFQPGGWPGDRELGDAAGGAGHTSEPGPSRESDMRQPPEELEGLDRPALYHDLGRPPTDLPRSHPSDVDHDDDGAVTERDRTAIERRGMDPDAADPRPPNPQGADPRGEPVQPFGDQRFGQPDEWSTRQEDWTNRPSRYEDSLSGLTPEPAADLDETADTEAERRP